MRTGNEIGVLLEIQSVGSTSDAIGPRQCAEAVSNLKDNIVACTWQNDGYFSGKYIIGRITLYNTYV